MRKLLLGTANNIPENISKVKLWHNSFKKVCDGDVMLIVPGLTNEDKELLGDIPHTRVKPPEGTTVNNDRLVNQEHYLKLHLNDYDVVLVTDVFDVVFLKNPFINFELDRYDLYYAGEGVVHREEPWNNDVLIKSFPEEVSYLQDKEIICSGVIAGKPLYVANLLGLMWMKCVLSDGHDIRDQAALNILHYKKENPFFSRERTKLYNINDNWCLHCAIGGPTQFFEEWGFKSILTKRYKVPEYKDYAIVHQFNRIPTWEKELQKYGS